MKEELGLVSPGLAKVILAIAEATADVADILRYADTGKAGGSNTFGVSFWTECAGRVE